VAAPDRPADLLLALYERALPVVYGYLFDRCRDRATAEDLTSETFLAAARTVRGRPDDEVTVPWLVGVARHKLVDHWRRVARTERVLVEVAADNPTIDEPWDAHVDGLRATETLAGCCVTAAPHVWRQVGLFDERYFLNFEDSDWSLRAAGAGVPLAVDTTLHIYHRVSASFTGAYTYLGLYYYVRNGLLFGRDRCGGSWRNSLRFLRRHVLPGLRRTEQPAGRRMVVAATAVRDYGCGRFGRAPRWLEERAADWSAPRSRGTKASRSGAGRR